MTGIFALLAVACGGESERSVSDVEATDGNGGARIGTDAEAGADDDSGGTAPGTVATEPGDAGPGGTSDSNGGTESGVVEGGASPGGGGAGGSVPEPMVGGGGSTGSGETPMPIAGCEPFALTTTSAENCHVEFRCDEGEYLYTRCMADGDSSLCECRGSNGFREYLFEGVSGFAACERAVDVCAEGEVVSIDGPRECSVSRSAGSDSCVRRDSCRRMAELADGVAAVESEFEATWCDRESTTSARCFCLFDGIERQYLIETSEIASSCDTVHAICGSEAEIEPKSDRECEVVEQNAEPDRCGIEELCSEALEAGDGVAATLLDSRRASCTATSDAGARCSCWGANGSLEFEVAGAPVTESTCVDALGMCESLDTLEITGDAQCRPTLQYADAQYCDATLECALEATIEGEPLRVYGALFVLCSPVGDGWTCTCTAGTNVGRLTIDIADPWEACTEAMARCPEAVDVQPSDLTSQ